jgi:protein-S-isoprenylcysteine O-methyltransferase Ste14
MLLVLFGTLLRIVSAYTIGRYYDEFITVFQDHRIVRKGIYGLTRHPLHTALMIELCGFTLIIHHYAAIILLMLCIFVFFWRNICEEEFLLRILGDEYKNYLHEVPSVVDFVPTWLRHYITKNSINSQTKKIGT